MQSIPETPEGSSIQIEYRGAEVVMRWDRPSGGAGRYLPAAFLVFWLCGWTVGGGAALMTVLNGEGGLFLLAWLGGWAVGEIFAVYSLYSLLKPSIPESIRLGPSLFYHDSGRSCANFNPARWQQIQQQKKAVSPFSLMSSKQRVVDVSRDQISNLQLNGQAEDQRLSYDYKCDRIVIGEDLREPEREWLFEVLKAWHEAK